VIAAAKDGLYVLIWRDLGVGGSAWRLTVNEAHELVREVVQALGEKQVVPEDDE
jgi:hypothetical protein